VDRLSHYTDRYIVKEVNMTNTDGRSRVSRGVPTGGQFKTERHKANLAPVQAPRHINMEESMNLCLEKFYSTAEKLGATRDLVETGRGLRYRLDKYGSVQITVWANEDGSGFSGRGEKFTDQGYLVERTDDETIDGLEEEDAELLMLKLVRQTRKINIDPRWTEEYNKSGNPEDALEWARTGLSPQQANLWKGYGWQSDDVGDWIECGFDPYTDYEWIQDQDLSPYVAQAMQDEGFSAAEARQWLNSGWDSDQLYDMIQWRDAGVDPETAMEWEQVRQSYADSGSERVSTEQLKEWYKVTPSADEASKWITLFRTSDPGTSQYWRNFGFTADEYEQWYEFDPETAREKINAGIDFETAQAELWKERDARAAEWRH
jgi:hypothetical protein